MALIPADNTRFSIFEAACSLFRDKGFEPVSIQDITDSTGVKTEEIYKLFGNKEDIIFYLYKSINNSWETEVAELPEDKLPARFATAIEKKLQLVAPYKKLLRNLLPILLNDDGLGVFSVQNKVTRAQGNAIMNNLVLGSKGLSLGNKRKAELAKMLYLFHWSVLFISLHEEHDTKALKLLGTFTAWLKELNLAKQVMLPFLLPKMTALSDIVLDENTTDTTLAKDILDVIFNKRKLVRGSSCEKKYCEQCYNLHLPKVQYFIERNEPVHIILPAFPAKSPNLQKVLGKLPDLGEEIALLSLQSLCEEITRVYKPGAYITICADGRVFADLVQVPDEDVTEYTQALRLLIANLGIKNIEVVNLEDLVKDKGPAEARTYVVQHYAEPMDSLREKIKQGEQHKTMFNGMHRFITEDRLYTEPEKSKSRIKEEAKDIAIEVIQRSNAWTKFLGYYYPNALRLSIHPQAPHSEKIGIKLTKATDEWITPWHGVIVLKKDSYTLMKRHDAEQMQATLVYKDGHPSHYTLTPNN